MEFRANVELKTLKDSQPEA